MAKSMKEVVYLAAAAFFFGLVHPAHPALLASDNKWEWSWEQTYSEVMALSFDTGGGCGISLDGGLAGSTEFQFHDGTKLWRYDDLGDKKTGIWDKVNCRILYAPKEPKGFQNDIKKFDVSGEMQGLDINLSYQFEKDSLDITVEVKALKPGIKNFVFSWHQNNGPMDGYLIIQTKEGLKEVPNKKGFGKIPGVITAERVIPGRWIARYSFENAETVTLEEHGNPAVGSFLAVYPVKPDEPLEVGKSYRMRIKIKVEPTSLFACGASVKPADGREDPFFVCGEENRLMISVNKGAELQEIQLRDALTDTALGPTPFQKTDKAGDYLWTYKTDRPGVVELGINVKEKDGTVWTVPYEVVNIGKIEQKTVQPDEIEKSMGLVLVDEVNCGDQNDKHPFKDDPLNSSKIINTALGPCRELGAKVANWAHWQMKINRLHKPHMVEVEYPDDGFRTIGIAVSDTPESPCTYVEYPRTGVGAVCGGYYPNSGQLRKMKTIYFYPEDRDVVITVGTGCDDSPAAVKSIRMYEITGDIPAVEMKNIVKDRYFGFMCERPLRTSFGVQQEPLARDNCYGAPKNRVYHNAYSTIANYIRFMRLSGQNFASLGVWMYDWGYYKSRYLGKNRTPFYRHYSDGDQIGLWAKMFQANDMSLILSVEFSGTPSLFAQAKRLREDATDGNNAESYTSEALRIRQVSNQGKVQKIWTGPLLNYQSPEVEGTMVAIIDEIAARYGNGKFPAVKGVGVISGCVYGPSYNRPRNTDDPFVFSYDDVTTSQFEKDASIKIPVDEKDAQRFQKRFDWIMKNARDAWVDWRCRKIHSAHMKIAKAINSNGLRYYLMPTRDPMDVLLQYHWRESGRDILQLQRDEGFDYRLYQKIKGIVLARDYYTSDVRRMGPGDPRSRKPDDGVSREYNLSPLVRAASDNGPENTLHYIHNQFYEYHVKDMSPFGKKISHIAGDYFWPSDKLMGDDFVTALSAGEVPGTILFYWMDSYFPVSFWEGLAGFARVYRTLPLGEYQTLSGKDFDRNVIIREAKIDNSKYFFIVNPCFWPVEVSLQIKGDAREITDLAADKAMPSTTFSLGPYEARSFKAPATLIVAGVGAQVGQAGKTEVEKRLKNLEEFCDSRGKDSQGAEEIKAIKDGIARARQAFLENDYWGALRNVEGFQVQRAKRLLQSKKTE